MGLGGGRSDAYPPCLVAPFAGPFGVLWAKALVFVPLRRKRSTQLAAQPLNLYKTSLLALALRLLFCQLLLRDVLFVSQPKKPRKLVVPAVLRAKSKSHKKDL